MREAMVRIFLYRRVRFSVVKKNRLSHAKSASNERRSKQASVYCDTASCDQLIFTAIELENHILPQNLDLSLFTRSLAHID